MEKIILIAQREFLSRVKKKTFLLTTIGLPLLIALLYAMIIFFMVKPSDTLRIAVSDNANLFKDSLKSDKSELQYNFVSTKDEDVLKQELNSNKIDAYVWIPTDATIIDAKGIRIIAGKSIGPITQENIKTDINSTLKTLKLGHFNLSKEQMNEVRQEANIEFKSLDGKKDKSNIAVYSYAVGYISGFLIYLVLFIYGAMVMRGVMEEKINRIAEVIVSSVKPFQLMMGKIIGIGAVGLVQFIIWLVLVLGMRYLVAMLFLGDSASMMAAGGQSQGIQAFTTVMDGLSQINIPLIIGCFIFYFLGGYFLYASLFAAVGSAVNEDMQDAQSMMLPITMPIIFAFVIMSKAVNDPSSAIAIFGSMFPFTSPIVMMARLPYGVPVWQLLVSMALLIVGIVGTGWFAAKIYRVGILMYGKKSGWKEMIKWIRVS